MRDVMQKAQILGTIVRLMNSEASVRLQQKSFSLQWNIAFTDSSLCLLIILPSSQDIKFKDE